MFMLCCVFQGLTFNPDQFAYSATPIRPDNSSTVFRLQISNSATGELLPVSGNPVTLALNGLADYSSPGNTSMKGYNISLGDFGTSSVSVGVTVLFLEFTLRSLWWRRRCVIPMWGPE